MFNVFVFLFDDEKFKCDLFLIFWEIILVICGLLKGKIFGFDGLFLEFYIKFCDLFVFYLVDLFNFSFENGFFSSLM